MKYETFNIHVPESDLIDLRHRLKRTRLAPEIANETWEYGTNGTYLRNLLEYWEVGYDWRKHETHMNSFDNFKTIIQEIPIHFMYQRGKGPNPIPLIITHGWPSCFFEMTKIIPLLADPASHGGDEGDSFDVVAPSLPGFGFSGHSQERGMEVQRVADMWNKLMTQNLGYPRFAAQGGDIGSGVTARLGFAHSDSLFVIHVTSITRPTPYLGPGSRPLTDAEQALITQREKWFDDEGGYNHIQGTKPQTLAYGLNDSPVGLASWIVEKYRTWSDCGGDVEKSYTKDELLTIVTIYWVTHTISSSTRMYYENQKNLWVMEQNQKVPAPAGMAMFPQEISKPPKEWGERSYDVQRWTEMTKGGHFAALEEPQLLAEDVRAFFRRFRNT